MDAQEFRAWLDYMNINDSQAARLLEISRNTIAKYKAEGAPHVVKLACVILSAQRDYGERRQNLMNQLGDWNSSTANHFGTSEEMAETKARYERQIAEYDRALRRFSTPISDLTKDVRYG